MRGPSSRARPRAEQYLRPFGGLPLAFHPCPMCGNVDFDFSAIRADGAVIRRCCACGMATIPLRPRADDLWRLYPREYYSGHPDGFGYSGYEQSASENEEFSIVCGVVEQALTKGSRVVEVGCATGVLLDSLRGIGMRTVGVDLSPWAIERARAKGHDALVGTLEAQGFGSDSFACAIALDVVEHLPDPKAFMSEVWRVLKPGGLAIVGTPNYGLHDQMGDSYPGLTSSFEHFHYFDPVTLRMLSSDDQFEVISIESCNAPDPITAFVAHTKVGKLIFDAWTATKRFMGASYGWYRFFRQSLRKRLTARASAKMRGGSLIAVASKRVAR